MKQVFFLCSGSLQTTLRKMRRCSKRICRCGTHGPSADFFLKGIWAKNKWGKAGPFGSRSWPTTRQQLIPMLPTRRPSSGHTDDPFAETDLRNRLCSSNLSHIETSAVQAQREDRNLELVGVSVQKKVLVYMIFHFPCNQKQRWQVAAFSTVQARCWVCMLGLWTWVQETSNLVCCKR